MKKIKSVKLKMISGHRLTLFLKGTELKLTEDGNYLFSIN